MTPICRLRIDPDEIAAPSTRAAQRAHYDAVRARLGAGPIRAMVRPAPVAAVRPAAPQPVSAVEEIAEARRERDRIRCRIYRITKAAERAGISTPDIRPPKLPESPKAKFRLPALPDDHDPSRLTAAGIIDYVAAAYGVSAAEVRSDTRTAGVVMPRQIAMYLLRVLTQRSLPDIARRIGRQDHTTVLHAVRKITALIAEDAGRAQEVEALRLKLTGGAP
ncbi:helix-turn-helix domain-containing protein [Xanthobacter albus]|uniref:helix-turn-helix domain-containing protein n=1 Tax=Xanthobacter albus TaxID=3119929 RepID=UPI00372D1A62